MRTALLSLTLLLWITACSGATTPLAQTVPPSPTPELAHQFSLPSLNGDTVALQDLRGRWVIVNFWATWCGPCRDEMPYLEQIATDYADQVTVLGVNMREKPGEIRPFVNEVAVAFPILLDPDDEMLRWYSPRGLPLTYVVAPDGTVAYQQYGVLAPDVFDAWLQSNIHP